MAEPEQSESRWRNLFPSWREALEYYTFFSDIVTGPSFRLRANLYQLVLVIMGACAGAVVAKLLFPNYRHAIVAGIYCGAFASLLISGTYIGVERARFHWRRLRECPRDRH